MSVRIDAAADALSRTANLPSPSAVTVMGWSRIAVDQGTGVLQIISILVDAGNTESIFLAWDNTTSAGSMRLVCTVGGLEASAANLSSRPAVNDVFVWYMRCSGTGAGQLEAGWRDVNANTWTTATATLTTFTPATLSVASFIATYYLNGRLWNVKCWDRALTQDEIHVESYYRRPIFPSSINFWWPLDSSSDTQDYSGNARNPTVGGTLATEDSGGQRWCARSPRRFIPNVPIADNQLAWIRA